MPDRWKRYGIDPAEITASVDAALIGNVVARQCAEDASAALLRTLSERATPLTKSSTRAQQAAISRSRRCHLQERRLTIRNDIQGTKRTQRIARRVANDLLAPETFVRHHCRVCTPHLRSAEPLGLSSVA